MDSYFIPNEWTPILCPQPTWIYMNFFFFSNQTWIFMGFYGLHQFYAQQVWIYTFCQMHMDFYGLLCCTKHVSICMYSYLLPNTHDSTDILHYMDFYFILNSQKLWIYTLVRSRMDFYGFYRILLL